MLSVKTALLAAATAVCLVSPALAQATPDETVTACVAQARKEAPAQFDAYLDPQEGVKIAPLTNGSVYTAFLFQKCLSKSGQFVTVHPTPSAAPTAAR